MLLFSLFILLIIAVSSCSELNDLNGESRDSLTFYELAIAEVSIASKVFTTGDVSKLIFEYLTYSDMKSLILSAKEIKTNLKVSVSEILRLQFQENIEKYGPPASFTPDSRDFIWFSQFPYEKLVSAKPEIVRLLIIKSCFEGINLHGWYSYLKATDIQSKGRNDPALVRLFIQKGDFKRAVVQTINTLPYSNRILNDLSKNDLILFLSAIEKENHFADLLRRPSAFHELRKRILYFIADNNPLWIINNTADVLTWEDVKVIMLHPFDFIKTEKRKFFVKTQIMMLKHRDKGLDYRFIEHIVSYLHECTNYKYANFKVLVQNYHPDVFELFYFAKAAILKSDIEIFGCCCDLSYHKAERLFLSSIPELCELIIQKPEFYSKFLKLNLPGYLKFPFKAAFNELDLDSFNLAYFNVIDAITTTNFENFNTYYADIVVKVIAMHISDDEGDKFNLILEAAIRHNDFYNILIGLLKCSSLKRVLQIFEFAHKNVTNSAICNSLIIGSLHFKFKTFSRAELLQIIRNEKISEVLLVYRHLINDQENFPGLFYHLESIEEARNFVKFHKSPHKTFYESLGGFDELYNQAINYLKL